jgi:hypothetical protein
MSASLLWRHQQRQICASTSVLAAKASQAERTRVNSAHGFFTGPGSKTKVSLMNVKHCTGTTSKSKKHMLCHRTCRAAAAAASLLRAEMLQSQAIAARHVGAPSWQRSRHELLAGQAHLLTSRPAGQQCYTLCHNI